MPMDCGGSNHHRVHGLSWIYSPKPSTHFGNTDQWRRYSSFVDITYTPTPTPRHTHSVTGVGPEKTGMIMDLKFTVSLVTSWLITVISKFMMPIGWVNRGHKRLTLRYSVLPRFRSPSTDPNPRRVLLRPKLKMSFHQGPTKPVSSWSLVSDATSFSRGFLVNQCNTF
jgi:hypothetical protein